MQNMSYLGTILNIITFSAQFCYYRYLIKHSCVYIYTPRDTTHEISMSERDGIFINASVPSLYEVWCQDRMKIKPCQLTATYFSP
jgi:hypothetical protein